MPPVPAPPAAPPRARSPQAARLLADLMAIGPDMRRGFLASLERDEIEQVLLAADTELGTPYGLWADDPVGFVEDVLGETLWSVPKQIMRAVVANRRVAVPSCFGSSKTHSAARLVLWRALTTPVGPARIVTLAPKWSHVHRQMWPEIRGAHARAGLPGVVDMAQLKLGSREGLEIVVAYGKAVQPWDESAVQGIHGDPLLLIVDEAGGIGHVIGRNLRGMLVGSNTRMLAIGNPPTDEEGSWFEGICGTADVVVIPISAHSTPNLSGEAAPRCRTCPAEMPAHSLASHLVDQEWVDDAITENGADSNYVQAKVYARFPRGGPGRAIPASWVDGASDSPEPDAADGWERLCDLGLPDEGDPWMVREGAWVRLGVDVAADGGDELAITRLTGDLAQLVHVSAGPANANAVDVAGVVLAQIRRAQALRSRLGTKAKVRVKIDGIGVGWGVAGILEAWASEGLHDAEIVNVVVSEVPDREPESATLRPYRKRDEMWLAGRALLQPTPAAPEGRLRLRVPTRTLAQLRAPTMSTSSSGHTVIEPKKKMKGRGMRSPDQAESLLLAVYEPASRPRRKPAKLISLVAGPVAPAAGADGGRPFVRRDFRSLAHESLHFRPGEDILHRLTDRLLDGSGELGGVPGHAAAVPGCDTGEHPTESEQPGKQCPPGMMQVGVGGAAGDKRQDAAYGSSPSEAVHVHGGPQFPLPPGQGQVMCMQLHNTLAELNVSQPGTPFASGHPAPSPALPAHGSPPSPRR